MKSNLTLLLLTVAALFVGTGSASAQVDWRYVRGPDGAFVVEMPGTPQHEAKEDNLSAGMLRAYHHYTVTYVSERYEVQTFKVPQQLAASKSRQVLQALVDNTSKNLRGGKWLEVTSTEIQGVPGIAGVGITVQGYALRGLFVVKGERFVLLIFSGPLGNDLGPDAERFFSSLRLE